MKKICKNCNHFDKCVRVYNLYSCCIDYEAKPLTEQEYLQTCNTEQLAEEISHLVFGGDFKKHISKMGYINMHSFKTEIVEWLKKPHTIEGTK